MFDMAETFSYIFVDEAECMLEAEAVCPVILAGDTTKVVLSGDLMKLQPESFLSEFFCHPTVLQRLEKFYPARHPMKCKLEELYCNHKDIVQVTFHLKQDMIILAYYFNVYLST